MRLGTVHLMSDDPNHAHVIYDFELPDHVGAGVTVTHRGRRYAWFRTDRDVDHHGLASTVFVFRDTGEAA